jgi:hypothetical protein
MNERMNIYIYIYIHTYIHTTLVRFVLFSLLSFGRPTESQLKNKQRKKHSRHVTLINFHVDAVIFRYVSSDFGLGNFRQRVAFVQ